MEDTDILADELIIESRDIDAALTVYQQRRASRIHRSSQIQARLATIKKTHRSGNF